MTNEKHDIQTISTQRADLQTDRILLLGQETEKIEKAKPSHFLKFVLANASQNQKSTIFPNPQMKNNIVNG